MDKYITKVVKVEAQDWFSKPSYYISTYRVSKSTPVKVASSECTPGQHGTYN